MVALVMLGVVAEKKKSNFKGMNISNLPKVHCDLGKYDQSTMLASSVMRTSDL